MIIGIPKEIKNNENSLRSWLRKTDIPGCSSGHKSLLPVTPRTPFAKRSLQRRTVPGSHKTRMVPICWKVIYTPWLSTRPGEELYAA